MAKVEEFTFLSNNGKNNIHCMKWMPENGEFKAILQITHGMVEYIKRYDDFAKYIADQGFLVVGHDHLGHGQSVNSPEELGFFDETDPSGALVKDMHSLRTLIQSANPGIPYFMMGHSMGSYMLRKYLASYSEGLDGAVIMGTGAVDDGTTKMGLTMLKVLAAFHGWHYRSKFIQGLSYDKYYKKYDCWGKDYNNSWLSKNVDNVRAYYHDPLCTFRFTLNGYRGLMEAVLFDNQKENVEKVRKDLPIFFVSGQDDPVGACGTGVKKVYDMFKETDHTDITYKLYENDRHEILNEPDHETVYADLAAWLKVRVEA